MNKNIIKSYVNKLKENDVIMYGLKEGVNVTLEEAHLFVDTVRKRIDEILDGKAFQVLESVKDKVSNNAYLKMHELISKYKKFIE